MVCSEAIQSLGTQPRRQLTREPFDAAPNAECMTVKDERQRRSARLIDCGAIGRFVASEEFVNIFDKAKDDYNDGARHPNKEDYLEHAH